MILIIFVRLKVPLGLLPGHCLNVGGDSAVSQVLIVEMQKDPQMCDGKRIREKGSDSYLIPKSIVWQVFHLWCSISIVDLTKQAQEAAADVKKKLGGFGN